MHLKKLRFGQELFLCVLNVWNSTSKDQKVRVCPENFWKSSKLQKSNNIGYLGRWVAKLVARLATAALWVRIQIQDISQKYKIGDISKGVANTL